MAHQSYHHHQALDYTNLISSTTDPVVIQGFPPSQEMYSLPAAGMDTWRAPFPMAGGSSAAASIFPPPPSNENLMFTPERAALCPWPPPPPPNRMLVDESSARFLFPSTCAGNGQPSSGLSLSLNHIAETSNSGYDQPPFDHPAYSNSRGELLQPTFFQSSISPTTTNLQQQSLLKSSKYLLPARELLNEFCNLDATAGGSGSFKHKAGKSKQCEEEGSSSSPPLAKSLHSLDIHELQARKAKLLCMVEEVDRRYRRYREQMKAVVSSFEATAGEGAATVYSTLASRVMSRHFRCLRDAITGQLHAIRAHMGEKDIAVAPGTTRGETPRLKLIDQCLRQQKAFQQVGMMESHPWRPQRGLPERSVSILRAWLFEHFLHPYPSDVDKHILARQTGLSRSQVSNWFINARVRLWKPMVEEMYLEETKEQENQSSQEDNNNSSKNINVTGQPIGYHSSIEADIEEDQKPAAGQLLGTDSDSLAWIINSSNERERIGGAGGSKSTSSFGVIDLDFASYGNQYSNHSFGSGAVSLTLGLQQHGGGGGMSLSFSPSAPAASHQPLLFSREQMEECQGSQFSILGADQAQHLPYRNLMGAHQLLRDLAG